MTAVPNGLKLTESYTMELLDIVSNFVEPSEVDLKKSIDYRNKLSLAETQTSKYSEKSKGSETMVVKIIDNFVNASAWDLYDTYAQVGGEERLGIEEFQLLIDTALKTKGVIGAHQIASSSEWTKLSADKQMSRIVKMKEFQYCVLTMERLLASQTFSGKQTAFSMSSIDVSKHVCYQPRLLWTYDNHEEKPLAVTSLQWHHINPLILAVGYGRLELSKRTEGCVCIWSAKNPIHPERKFPIPHTVTTVAFSKLMPNLLAVGCRAGVIYLIDVVDTESSFEIIHPGGTLPTRSGPIWKVEWFTFGDNERLISVSHSGFISCYSPGQNAHLLKLNYCVAVKEGEFASNSLSGLHFSFVQKYELCYVSTKEGIVAKCRMRSPCNVLSRIPCHSGPVFVVQQSPACWKFFLTCGADGCIKIWLDDLQQPLITLTSNGVAVVWATWSPTHPTILACVTNNELQLWDISIRCSHPVSFIKMRTSDQCYTTIAFSNDGKSLVIGDVFGHVRLYQLNDLPVAPILKAEALTTAIKKSLSSDVQKILCKFIQANPRGFQTEILL